MIHKMFSYQSECKSVNIDVEFIQGHPLKFTHLGKTWAKRTQCNIKINGFIAATYYVTKHTKDKDNLKYAYMNAFNPIKKCIYKEARINITNQILEFVNNENI